MTTRAPPPALSMRPLQASVTPGSATPPGARPRQATTATSHHPRSHTQNPVPPSKIATVRSWIGRTKIYLGAAIGILTLIVTIVSLLPSFAGGRYGKEALELALWTARKDYVEACQTYLNHTNIDCQHALEKGLPPPPGLDRIAARSLQKLKDHVQWLELQPLTHETDDHAVGLRLYLLTGIIILALILIRQWNRFTRLVRRQRAELRWLDGSDDFELHDQQWEAYSVAEPAMLRMQAISTGLGVENRRVPKSRKIQAISTGIGVENRRVPKSRKIQAISTGIGVEKRWVSKSRKIQAISTGIGVEKRWVSKSRKIPPGGQLMSQDIAHRMDSINDEFSRLRKRFKRSGSA